MTGSDVAQGSVREDWGAERGFAAVLLGEDRGFAESVTLLGGRLVARIGWRRVAEELGRTATRPVLLVEAEHVGEDVLLGALPRIDAVASALDLPVVVALAVEQIDLVAAMLLTRHRALLVAPTAVERLAAVAAATGRLGDPVLRDRLREGEAAKLERLGDEVARIAELLARLVRRDADGGRWNGDDWGSNWGRSGGLDDRPDAGAGIEDRRATFGPAPVAENAVELGAVDPGAIDPGAVRQVIRSRRLRDAFLGPGLFEDPAWDILLDLFAAGLEGTRVSVSSLCIASAVAPTTALRWIGKLADLGLLDREADPGDRRRAFVALSEKARQGMAAYLVAVRRAGLPIA